MTVFNATRNTSLADRCQIADSFWKRLVGLLLHSALKEGEGMLFPSCQAIHTLGMRFPIDVVWMDNQHRIVHLAENLPPLRVRVCRNAATVLELPPGVIGRTQTSVGDTVLVSSTTASHTEHCR